MESGLTERGYDKIVTDSQWFRDLLLYHVISHGTFINSRLLFGMTEGVD